MSDLIDRVTQVMDALALAEDSLRGYSPFTTQLDYLGRHPSGIMGVLVEARELRDGILADIQELSS